MGDLVKFPARRTETCPHCLGMGKLYNPYSDEFNRCALCAGVGCVTLAERRTAPPPTIAIPLIGPVDA